MFRLSDLRPPEWLLIGYFSYVAVVASWFFPSLFASWKAWALAVAVAISVRMLGVWTSALGRIVRDFAPLAFTLTAYREMNWFTPAIRDHHLERTWIVWDRWLLDQGHLRRAIESGGVLLPSCFELSYFLVYGVAPVSLALLFLNAHRDNVSRFWLAYLAGTLGAYALLPYFLSEPPRVAFPGSDLPHVSILLRQANLWILGGYAIHSSVFPSAHVSSAFSAAWALRATIPERPWIGWLMGAYAVSVAIATVYGRYHYTADALAGFAVSLAVFPCLVLTAPRPAVSIS